uniref:Putative cuticle protein 6-like zootermopsis nevadensis n=1 Tax=Lutzomyia longipalpis TaxID=7200 RepID=A0A1B0CQL7_LUTLO
MIIGITLGITKRLHCHMKKASFSDELGQYSYGYSGGPSAKTETKTFDGITRGAYSYIDANGLLQSVEYTADPIHGFRAAATNLPVAPVDTGVAPEPVKDTPEGFSAEGKAATDQAGTKFPFIARAYPWTIPAAVLPAPVTDTPEVAKAKEEHLGVVVEAKSAHDRREFMSSELRLCNCGGIRKFHGALLSVGWQGFSAEGKAATDQAGTKL